jgi:polyisoprenyl-phosphate glycosyltransferase
MEPELTPRANPRLLSIVIPIYNERTVLPLLRKRLEAVGSKLPCPIEWVLVNDGSRDGSSHFLLQWAEQDPRAKVVDFARNFGHQAAVTAGVDHSGGEAIVVMDADLQDPPELVLEMLARYRDGYDIVYAQRIKRHGEGFFKRGTAAALYWLMRTFVHKDLPVNTGDFRLMSRDAAQALSYLREGQRFMRGMVAWLGFHQVAVPFERPPRAAGETKYPLYKMLRFAWDAILSFSSAPLKLGTYVGITVFAFGLIMGAYSLIRELLYHDLVPGWPTLVILHCVIGGATLVSIGMIGEYVGRIYDEIKQRPIYIVRRTANLPAVQLPARAVPAATNHEISRAAQQKQGNLGA